ncbi:MAG: ImmA/IrrE family metallo-endopeptidase [bacterium]
MSKEAYPALARRRANQLLDELAITSFPVDPERVAAAKGIQIETHAKFPKGRYGALVRQGDLFRIVVWDGCPTLGHRRFTIAHELGHYHLDGHIEALLASTGIAVSSGGNYTGRKDPFEVEADAFASELLMAERFARPVIKALSSGLAAVREVANRFVVSFSAAAIRCGFR